jgi:hypothetical protein
MKQMLDVRAFPKQPSTGISEITWSYLDLALINLGPFCVLTVGNVCIIIKIKYGQRPASTSSDNADSRRLDGFTLKVMTLCVVFVVCMTPVNIYFLYGLSLFGNELKIAGKDSATQELVWALVIMMMFTNNVVNFPLYCLAGRRVVTELKLMLRCCNRRSALTPQHNNISHVRT